MKFEVIDKRTGKEADGLFALTQSGAVMRCDEFEGWSFEPWWEVVSEPDTAEKLLWLVENLYFDGRGKSIYVCKNEKMFSAYYENHEEYLEAINIVYKWAKEQENG